DVQALDLDASDRSRRLRYPVLVDYSQRDSRQRQSYAAADPLAVERIRSVHSGLAHSVALENGLARAGAKFVEGFGQERSRAGDEESHRAARLLPEATVGEQPCVEGRNTHHHARMRQLRNDFVDVELGQ